MNSTTQLIRLENVSKSYLMGQARVAALREVTLSIEAGEFTALTGPSGSGKSTLLNLCGLIDQPDAGHISIDDQATGKLSQKDLTLIRREKIGFVFQGFNLVPVMTAFENIEYPLFLAGAGAAARRERVDEILSRVGLSEQAQRRPDELSGGQRQRVAIARALVKKPRLVVADEPTANLDSATATQIIDLMHELGRSNGTTFVIATHDARVTSRCDRSIVLTDGVLQ
ncbi:MAG: ABC transporter ATP-binding protein [Betaproteobacteria bacterium]|nr:ABC transporter ATP-binding protein [Betaproteobacteria bacterium]